MFLWFGVLATEKVENHRCRTPLAPRARLARQLQGLGTAAPTRPSVASSPTSGHCISACLGPWGCHAQALGREVRGCVWQREQLPASGAAAALGLWGVLLQHPGFRARWVAGPDWMVQLEALLCVRQPTSVDLTHLYPNVEWAEQEGQFVLRAALDAGHFVRDAAAAAAALQRVEELQAEIMLLLWHHTGDGGLMYPTAASTACCRGGRRLGGRQRPQWEQQQQRWWQGASQEQGARGGQRASLVAAVEEAAGGGGMPTEQPPSPPPQEQPAAAPAAELSLPADVAVQQQPAAAGAGVQQQQQEPRAGADDEEEEEQEAGHLLRCFLQYLIDRNHGMMRNVPPPGLSPPSVLVSAYWAGVRLARRQLEVVHVAGAGFEWDPATWLQGRPLSQGDDPYFDEARLGGTLSHLAREHPPGPAERAQLPVPPCQRHTAWGAAVLPPGLHGPSDCECGMGWDGDPGVGV